MKKNALFAIVAILIISCAADKDAEDYHPLSVGLQWEYAVTQIDTITTTGIQVSTITAEVSSSSGTLYEQVTSTAWDDTAMTAWLDTSYLQEKEGNVLFYSDLNDPEPDTLLVLPLVLGNTWTVRTETWGNMTGEVVGIENAVVPAGTCTECWVIEYAGLDDTGHSWYAARIGLVKHRAAGPANEFLKELTEFIDRK